MNANCGAKAMATEVTTDVVAGTMEEAAVGRGTMEGDMEWYVACDVLLGDLIHVFFLTQIYVCTY